MFFVCILLYLCSHSYLSKARLRSEEGSRFLTQCLVITTDHPTMESTPQIISEESRVVGVPSLQSLAAAAMLQVPNRQHRPRWTNGKRYAMLRQMGYEPIVRTRRHRALWGTGELLRVYPGRIPDLVIEMVFRYASEEEEEPSEYAGIVYAAPVFTTGRILLLEEHPMGTASCYALYFNCGVEKVRSVYDAIDAVPLSQVRWRFDVPVFDIENRQVPSEMVRSLWQRQGMFPGHPRSIGARDDSLDDQVTPPSPPPPLRRTSRRVKLSGYPA